MTLYRWILALGLALGANAVFSQGLKPWTGAATPPLKLESTDGVTHSLADYRGKVVLVNFWATWCGPCREEMPSMEALRLSMQGKPFIVLAVNVGEGGRVARDFGDKLMLEFPLLLDRDTRTAKAWGARVLPASYLIGTDGTIRYSYFGELDWTSDDIRRKIEAMMPKEAINKASR